MDRELVSDIKKYVNYLLLPLEDLYYHQYEHALSVMERSIYLATMEWCSSNEIEMLIIAALFHDTGFVIQYEENEIYGAKIAKNYLRTILYPQDKIEIIENIILATQPTKKPNTLLEEIIKDADMDNLWRDDFLDIGERLKKERESIKNIKIHDPDWHHASLDLLSNHKFYTSTEQEERSEKLKENAKKVIEKLQK